MADRWPWDLTPKPGAELALTWNLPDAANEPLFGLPPLPPNIPLPKDPFRNILRFEREHAWIFFGRGYDIRKLYKSVTAPDGQPIVLFYGESGVGKSSLLAAGLLPRLEQEQAVVYARRDPQMGLLQTLSSSLSGSLTDEGKAAKVSSGTDLRVRWCAIESETGKPLTVILDQAEEVERQPKSATTEKNEFLDALVAVFGTPSARPQGRLLLGFRQEWLADIDDLLRAHSLPSDKVYLAPMDTRGIIEAVNGPEQTPRLYEHFGLTVKPDLAELIAGDLLADSLADSRSQVALILQILLDKMWQAAKATKTFDQAAKATKTFDKDLYHVLSANGLLLSGFLDEQLGKLHQSQPTASACGLALDLLAYHTTQLGYADQRTLQDLSDTYPHQIETLPDLLRVCRDLSLLVASIVTRPDDDPAKNRPADDSAKNRPIDDPAKIRPAGDSANRLAHDTLAPLVRQRFAEPDAPGQRARRILESRAVEWKGGKTGTPLDDADLALVEAGKPGMRGWNDEEERLVTESRLARKKRNRNKQWIRRGFAAAVFVILVAAGIAFWQWGEANDQKAVAENNAATAVAERIRADENADAEAAAAATAQAETRRADEKAEIAFVRQLLAQAELSYEENPLLGLRLALEADAHLTYADAELRRQISRRINSYVQQGRIAKLSDNAAGILDVPGTPWLVIQESIPDVADELYSKANGALIDTLTGKIENIYPMDEDIPFFTVDYDLSPGELRNKADGLLKETLTGKIENIYLMDKESPVFKVDYDLSPDELRNKADGSLVMIVTGVIRSINRISEDSPIFVIDYDAYHSPDGLLTKVDGSVVVETTGADLTIHIMNEESSFFVASYSDSPGEFRSKSDGSLIETLPGRIWDIDSMSADSSVFVVSYQDLPIELRNKANGSLVKTLAGGIGQIHNPYSRYYDIDEEFPFLVVRYNRSPGELRSKIDGSLVETLTGEISSIYSMSAESPVFAVSYRDSPIELRSKTDGALMEILTGGIGEIYYPYIYSRVVPQ